MDLSLQESPQSATIAASCLNLDSSVVEKWAALCCAASKKRSEKNELCVALSDVVPAAVAALEQSLSCSVTKGSPAEVAAVSDVVLLAVKPGDMAALCADLTKVEGSRLYLSIAAGLKLADLESWLGSQQRVIRSMPNTPALVGTGAAAFSRGSSATADDAALARKILGASGHC